MVQLSDIIANENPQPTSEIVSSLPVKIVEAFTNAQFLADDLSNEDEEGFDYSVRFTNEPSERYIGNPSRFVVESMYEGSTYILIEMSAMSLEDVEDPIQSFVDLLAGVGAPVE